MNTEKEEQRSATRLAIALTVVGVASIFILLWGGSYLFPTISSWVDGTFSQGLGLKTSAIISACVSVIVILVFAVVAGDGLLGEFQFMVPFFSVFSVFLADAGLGVLKCRMS